MAKYPLSKPNLNNPLRCLQKFPRFSLMRHYSLLPTAGSVTMACISQCAKLLGRIATYSQDCAQTILYLRLLPNGRKINSAEPGSMVKRWAMPQPWPVNSMNAPPPIRLISMVSNVMWWPSIPRRHAKNTQVCRTRCLGLSKITMGCTLYHRHRAFHRADYRILRRTLENRGRFQRDQAGNR